MKVAVRTTIEIEVKMGDPSIAGTGFMEYMPEGTTYAELVKVFGTPHAVIDGDKVDVIWKGTINGSVFSIYNYKDGKNYLGAEGKDVKKITKWHIGGRGNADAGLLIKYFRAVLSEVEGF